MSNENRVFVSKKFPQCCGTNLYAQPAFYSIYWYLNWLEMRSTVYRYDAWLTTYDVLAKQGKEYPHSERIFFETLQKANPYIKKIEFIGTELWLKVEIDDYFSDYLPIHLHSDGIVSFTEMVAELAYRCIVLNGSKQENAIIETNGIVLIDEIDLHLHPKWQRHVVADLKTAFPGIQFVATTHSPFIVQSLEADELINLDSPISLEEAGLQPVDLTLNQVATEIMQVENLNSDNFEERFDQAKEVFQNLNANGHDISMDDYSSLKQLIDGLVMIDTEDPVYKAYLTVKNAHE